MAACAACLPEDAVDVGLPSRAEPGACVGCHAPLEAVEALRIVPVVRAPAEVQPPRPGSVVGLSAGAHLPTPILQSLHARRAGGVQEVRLRGGIRAGRARDLRRLGRRQPSGAERGVRLRQRVQPTCGLECPARGADRLARRLGDPVRRAAMPRLAPDLRLLDPSGSNAFIAPHTRSPSLTTSRSAAASWPSTQAGSSARAVAFKASTAQRIFPNTLPPA